jgi:hypothetical protein
MPAAKAQLFGVTPHQASGALGPQPISNSLSYPSSGLGHNRDFPPNAPFETLPSNFV